MESTTGVGVLGMHGDHLSRFLSTLKMSSSSSICYNNCRLRDKKKLCMEQRV